MCAYYLSMTVQDKKKILGVGAASQKIAIFILFTARTHISAYYF
jgi:hypothetical protein